MCPEFERYFREENKQLSSLEMFNNEPDPHAMVKEYRRAGADQEEPLPNELRSPEVLSRTMDYLICNIIDRVENEPGIVSDWYDFVWSRTRAIRKDITQQHLCDPISVALLEKCARFHIHCDHALIEEDASVFDSKINHENLSKCLQSLKDFYNDLNIKGTASPNESEFRGYYLLLNLGRPDILREVKLFHTSVRNSEPVQFALKCHFAMNTNNFIKFFDLVRSTTYLNACILHRYFYEVRLQAFKIMRKAYTITNQIEIYQFSELTRQLGFEHEDEIRVFCASIELECENDSVLLKRGKTNDGRANIQIIRSKALISSKRLEKTLSEIVQGGPIPENPYKKFPLHNSFDSNGRLKKESLIGTERRTRQIVGSSSIDRTPIPQPSQQQQQSRIREDVINQASIQLAQMLLHEVIRETVISNAGKVRTHIKWEILSAREAERICNSLISFIVSDIIRSSYHSVARQIKEVEIRAKDYRNAVDTVSNQLCDSLVNHYILGSLRNSAISILNASIKDHNVRKSRLLVESILEEVVNEQTKLIAQKCYEKLKNQEELVKYMKEKRSQRLAKHYFSYWRKMCLKVKRYRQIRATFPAANVECLSPRIESIQLKRKVVTVLESTESPIEPSPGKQKKSESNEPRMESMMNILKPKMFAEQVTNLSSTLDPVGAIDDSSPMEKLKRKLSVEKELGHSLRRSIETYRQFSQFDENGPRDDISSK